MGGSLSTAAINIPQANPYISQAGRVYAAIGSQNGMILPSTYNNLWGDGTAQTYPSSNDFGIAVQSCTAICDSAPGCLSFNVLTVSESDFNSGIPVYECRFSNKEYDRNDYTLDNGLDSYVWSIEPPEYFCFYSGNQLVPTDVPTDPVQGTFSTYKPMGNQNGKALASSEGSSWYGPPSTFPQSNSFADAVTYCAKACDADPACLSFNVFTVSESDYNNCLPTAECRFSYELYDSKDYTLDVGLTSYAWSVAPPTAPDCSFSSNAQMTPDAWVAAGMDSYLQAYAKVARLDGDQSDFLVKLMNEFGWVPYGCTSDQGDCNIEHIGTNCSIWLNYQVVNFEAYMAKSSALLNGLLGKVKDIGASIFDQVWWTPQLPSAPSVDPLGIAQQLIGGALEIIGLAGLVIPEANVVSTVGSIGDGIWGEVSANQGGSVGPYTMNPDRTDCWDAFVSQFADLVGNVSSGIDSYSASITHTVDLLNQITKGGLWSVPDPSTLMPDINTLWPQAKSYYAAMVTMQGMKAQSIFFMSLPVTVAGGSAPCTQAAADHIASIFGSGPSGVAWCQSSTQVLVPVVGYNMALYTNFPAVISQASTSYQTIWQASSACYPGFGTSTFSISLYNSAIQVPQWQKTPTESGSYLPNYDMTQACAWSVPICDYSTWKSLSKQAGWPGYNPSPTINDGILNTAWYFAYNLNFTPEAYFCADYQGSNGPYGAPPPLHSCQNWYPKRVVNLS